MSRPKLFYKMNITIEITKESASVEISNRVYQAALLFEQLESLGLIQGNGHHLAQKVAEFAKTLLDKRWRDAS
jgi:hypothetical protein